MPNLNSEQTPPSWDGSLEDDELFEDELGLEFANQNENSGGPSWGFIIGALVALVAVGFLVFDGLKAETYFFDVDQAVARSDKLVGELIRVRGTVEPGSFNGIDGSLDNRFRISEQGVSMSVIFQRALPDTFKEGTEVVAQGRLDEHYVLHADEVLVKCPSRYEGAPPTAHPEGVGQSEPQASR